MNPRYPLSAACLAAALTLAACGGGSSMTGDGAPPVLVASDDPRVARLGELLDRADALLLSSSHARWSLAAEGEATIEDTLVERVTCAGARCVAADGTETAVGDLMDTSGIDLGTIEASLGARDGFETVTASGTFEVSETLPDLTLTVSPEVTSYGFWGDHGFAALALGAGPLSAEIEGTAYTGDFRLAQAYAVGDATGTSPAGMGSATWTGIAEAAATGTLERLQGTATVTIADLSRPRVGVAIDVPGHDIGAPGWADMPLTDGRFTTGTAGADYLEGNFHGPGHEEAWGVFDTADHLGAFGAKRAQ